MTKEELKLSALKQLLSSNGWKDYMRPWLEDRIKQCNNIKKLDFKKSDMELTGEVRALRAKIDVYQSVLNYPVGQIKSLEEEKNG